MNRDAKKHLAIVSAALVALLIGAMAVRASRPGPVTSERTDRVRREAPKAAPQTVILPSPKFVAAAPERLAGATNDSALTTMVDNYLVAVARNDAATRQAMLSGLQRQPGRSAELLAARRKGTDPGTVFAIDQALQELQVNR